MYHKAGYLHLDIKPSNFIATADQTGQGKNIVLFDVDTVVSIGDIQSGKLRGVSYSKEYAAPEQKQQKVKKLCPATDLYAVGAVLFERIMNRRADCTDACMFAEWEFDSRFDIKNVKPKAKRLLTEIFHKTLAANIKRRYQSADELAAALEALRKVICEPAPYISSYPLNTTCHFVGRRDDLAQLHQALADSSFVFVKGASGIGKTELVRKYISIHQDEYDAVVFMLYNGSVSDCLTDIEIIGVDSEDKNKKSLLREICDNDKVLLILDNYDVAPNESKGLDELLDLNCKVIVTTRTDFLERNPNARFIEVAGLSAKALRVIFENESECTLSDSELDELKSILPIGKQCTYFWSMIARLAKEGAYTVSEIVEKVSAGLDDLAESEDVFDTKDGSFINTTVAAAMSVLFKLDELGDNEFEVLNALYFLDCLNMDKRQIKEMLTFSEIKLMNSFNLLVKKGYIQKVTVALREVYRISDVLRDVLEYKSEPESDIACVYIYDKLFDGTNIPANFAVLLSAISGFMKMGKIPSKFHKKEINDHLKEIKNEFLEICHNENSTDKIITPPNLKKINLDDLIGDTDTFIKSGLSDYFNLTGDTSLEGVVSDISNNTDNPEKANEKLTALFKTFSKASDSVLEKRNTEEDDNGIEIEIGTDENNPHSIYTTKKEVADTLKKYSGFFKQFSDLE